MITGVKNENHGTTATAEQTPDGKPPKPPREKFEPTKGKYRRPGTGSIHQVSKNVWEGRYSPIVNGKRIARNIYANSIEECEEKTDAIKMNKRGLCESPIPRSTADTIL